MGNVSTLSKGLEVNKINDKNKPNIIVCIPIIDGKSLGDILFFFLETKNVKNDNIKIHNINEPS